MNIIGSVVVAGNVRRSAQIAIGDCDDLEFLNAKNWGEGNIPNWRAMSNNSVVCNDIKMLARGVLEDV
jgi:ribonucleoside-triphosphate reductase (thioredoxin)